MRKIVIMALALGLLASAGCSGEPTPPPAPMPEVSGAFGTLPEIPVPEGQPGKAVRTAVLKEGTGPQTRRGQNVIAFTTFKSWREKKVTQSSHYAHQPTTFALDDKNFGEPFIQALADKKAGSRVLMVSPAMVAWGVGGAPLGINPGDHVIMVVDIVGGYDGAPTVPGSSTLAAAKAANLPKVTVDKDGPKVEIPAGKKAPAALVAETLVEGAGSPIAKGDVVVTGFVGVKWADGTLFDSSYGRQSPNAFLMDAKTLLPGWLDGLVGKKAGSRVLLVVPAALGTGFTATPALWTAPANSDNVYVVDILDVQKGLV